MRTKLFIIVAVITRLAVTTLSSQGNLLLWNKLGSGTEVSNSEVGPNLEVKGNLTFSPCKFGNGVQSDIDEIANVYGDSSIVLFDRGCVEFWWKPTYNWDSGDNQNYSVYFGISDWRPSPGTSPNDSNELYFLYVPDGPFFHFQFTYITKIDDYNYSIHTLSVSPIPFYTNDIIHLAAVWDTSKSIEGQYSMAIYQDGVLIGSTNHTIVPRSQWCADLDIAGRGQYDLVSGWNGCKGAVDNIKIWDYAKTDFSDRYSEDGSVPRPSEPQTNIPLPPRTLKVTAGSEIVNLN